MCSCGCVCHGGIKNWLTDRQCGDSFLVATQGKIFFPKTAVPKNAGTAANRTTETRFIINNSIVDF